MASGSSAASLSLNGWETRRSETASYLATCQLSAETPLPWRASVDPSHVNETRGSLWHMKVKFNMRCSSEYPPPSTGQDRQGQEELS